MAHAGPRLSLAWHSLPQEAKRRWQGSLWARRALFDCRTMIAEQLRAGAASRRVRQFVDRWYSYSRRYFCTDYPALAPRAGMRFAVFQVDAG